MQDTIAIAVLAGGQGRRMGGQDKALLQLSGQPLLGHLLGRLQPQANQIVLSANGDPARFSAFGLPVVADDIADAGPLAGILAAAAYCQTKWPQTQRLITIPVDTPFPPPDLVQRLTLAPDSGVGVAQAGGRLHWAVACWPMAAARRLTAAVHNAGLRRLETAIRAEGFTAVPFACANAFANINTPDDLKDLSALLTPP